MRKCKENRRRTLNPHGFEMPSSPSDGLRGAKVLTDIVLEAAVGRSVPIPGLGLAPAPLPFLLFGNDDDNFENPFLNELMPPNSDGGG